MSERTTLEAWLTEKTGATRVAIVEFTPLSGGAIQENKHLLADIEGGPFAGRLDAVVRMDAPTSVDSSHSRADEFALFQAAFNGSVCVPEPLWLCEDAHVLGGPFFVMRRIDGTAAGHRLVKMDRAHDGVDLVVGLGRELARIHALPTDGLSFLTDPGAQPATYWIDLFHRYLDDLGTPRPAIEWALRWLQRHATAAGDLVLAHHDFRTGNIMIDDEHVTGILDWEFAGIGEREDDIAWFCAKCWRFGANDAEAGGLGPRAAFYAGYEAESGHTIDADKVHYYEVMAHVRWAVIAAQQADRFVSGGEENLELALTGHVVPELELELLRMTGVT